MKKQLGFTLIELMVTLVVAAILVTVALPNMRYMLINNKITSRTNEFIGAINYVRSEAITRANQFFLIEPIDPNNWSKGWQVGNDMDGSHSLNKNSNEIIKIFQFTDQVKVIKQEPADRSSIDFLMRGRAAEQYKFQICSSGHGEGRLVTIERTGHASVDVCFFQTNNSQPCPIDCE